MPGNRWRSRCRFYNPGSGFFFLFSNRFSGFLGFGNRRFNFCRCFPLPFLRWAVEWFFQLLVQQACFSSKSTFFKGSVAGCGNICGFCSLPVGHFRCCRFGLGGFFLPGALTAAIIRADSPLGGAARFFTGAFGISATAGLADSAGSAGSATVSGAGSSISGLTGFSGTVFLRLRITVGLTRVTSTVSGFLP